MLPLRKIGRFRLPLAALVVGSIAPDLRYYIGQFRLATFAHSVPGLFLGCVPAGALALALSSRVRPALIRLLPHPHRHALAAAFQISHRTTRQQDLVLAPASPALMCMRYFVLADCLACACTAGWLAVVGWDDSSSRSGPVDVFRMAILATNSFAALLLIPAWAWRNHGDA